MTMAKKLLPLTIAMLGFVSCFDPVHSDSVDALGPEVAGVEEGPRHRPGQPCGACHGGQGPGPEFITGGTIYDRRGSTTPVEGVTVTLIDKNGGTTSVRTNDVGNFFIEQHDLAFPLSVELQYQGAATKRQMRTRIGRDAQCGRCHLGMGDSSHMPAVYLKEPNDP